MNKFNGIKVEYHILQSFPVTCLNRDDVGAPKTAIVGGVERGRISSQCWKRQVRLALREQGVRIAVRTKRISQMIESFCTGERNEEKSRYIGQMADARPTPTPPIMRYMLNAISRLKDGSPYGSMPLSGPHDPTAEMKNSAPAISRDFFLPSDDASTPEMAPPMTQPMSRPYLCSMRLPSRRRSSALGFWSPCARNWSSGA